MYQLMAMCWPTDHPKKPLTGLRELALRHHGDGHHVGDRILLGLIQLLRPALANLPPLSGSAPERQDIFIVYRQFGWFAKSLV